VSALELRGVSKSFGGVKAVRDLGFAVPVGSITGLMGPNGAGKTTVIDLISGQIAPDAGSIAIAGTETAGLPAHAVAGFGLARTYQNVRLVRGLSAVQQVITGCYLRRETSLLASVLHTPAAMRRMGEIEEQAMLLLDRVGMADRADVLAEALSYGEQRRVEIARALGSEPALLLLDEPTAGMNAQEADRIGRLIQALRGDGLSILLVEHNMRLVADTCDHAVVMNFGAKIAEGPPATCLDETPVQEAYFGRQRGEGGGRDAVG
jgi:branched-chain amino acid transport system ATP-binding protein